MPLRLLVVLIVFALCISAEAYQTAKAHCVGLVQEAEIPTLLIPSGKGCEISARGTVDSISNLVAELVLLKINVLVGGPLTASSSEEEKLQC